MSWFRQAACQDQDPDLFFPVARTSGDVYLNRAKQICARCPVKTACLEWALSTGTDYGVWGGLSADERRSLRRRATRIRLNS